MLYGPDAPPPLGIARTEKRIWLFFAALNDNKDESTPIDLALENLFLFCLLRTFLYALIMRNRSRAPSLSQALASKTRSVKSDFPASAVFMLMEMHLKWILPPWHCKTFCFFVFYKHFYTHLSGATVLRTHFLPVQTPVGSGSLKSRVRSASISTLELLGWEPYFWVHLLSVVGL